AEWDRRGGMHTLQGGGDRGGGRGVTPKPRESGRRFSKKLRGGGGCKPHAFTRPPRGAPPRADKPKVAGGGNRPRATEAELNLVAKPKSRGLLVPQFESLNAALDALAACLEFRPSAVELMDQMLIDLSRTQRALGEVMRSVKGHPAALLMVEFSGDND